MKSHGIIMHQAIIFVSLLTLACASAKGIVLSLCVCVCVSQFSQFPLGL